MEPMEIEMTKPNIEIEAINSLMQALATWKPKSNHGSTDTPLYRIQVYASPP